MSLASPEGTECEGHTPPPSLRVPAPLSSPAAPSPWETMNEADYLAFFLLLIKQILDALKDTHPKAPEWPASGSQLSGLAVSSSPGGSLLSY